MACHCCCKGRPRVHGNASLWKVDVATGVLIWAGDRGANGQALDVMDEGGVVMIYEAGIYAAGFLALAKWRDNGDGGDVLWRFAKSTNNIGQIQVSDSDASIWLSHAVTTATRVDSAGAEINSGTVAGANKELARVSNGNMNYWTISAGAVDQYDTSFSSVGSVSVSGTILPLSAKTNKWSGDTGWIADISSTQLRHYSSSLSTTETFTHGVGTAITPVGTSTTRFATVDGTANIRVYSLNPITHRYTVTITGTLDVADAFVVFDSANNIYFASNESGTQHIRSYDDSGNLRWDRTALSVTIGRLNVEDDMLFVSAATKSIDLDNSSDNFGLARLDTATGDTMWGAGYCVSGTHDCIRKLGDYVYVCGLRAFT